MNKGPYTLDEPFLDVWDISRGNKVVLTIYNFSRSKAEQVCRLLNDADRRAREEERAKLKKEKPGHFDVADLYEEPEATSQGREPEISCAEGCEARRVIPVNGRLSYGKRFLLHEIASDPRWTGRYGYAVVPGVVNWRISPRAWRHKAARYAVTVDPLAVENYIPLLPDYVEMRK